MRPLPNPFAAATDQAGGDTPGGATGGNAGATGRWARLWGTARRAAPRTAVAAVAGLALAAAFPPYGIWPLSLGAVAALSLLTRGRTGRQGAWLGFAFALPFFTWLLLWLRVVGFDALLGLAAAESLFFVALGAGLAITSRLPLWPVWAGCLWTAQELARDRIPFGGFPWGRLAFATGRSGAGGSPFTPLAALGGAPAVTFAVALTGALLAAALVRAAGRGRAHRWRALIPAALAGLVAVLGSGVPVHTDAADTVTVAVVQGNVPRSGLDFLGQRRAVLDNHVAATLDLARDIKAGHTPRPDLVIWPENSSDLDPFTNPDAYAEIDRAVQAVGVPVLVGALVDRADPDGIENQGIVWDPRTGPGAHYTKQHPVPFGEYVPFRSLLSRYITRLDRISRDFVPGNTTGVLQVGPARLGDVICFEVAYDEIVRDTVNSGGRALVVQTNNATYGHTGEPEQQLAMSRVRAVEHGRAILTAATSGISAFVAPDGRVVARTDEFTQTTLTARIPLRDEKTIADRVGAIPEWTVAMFGVLACAAAVRRGRRQKGQPATLGPEGTELVSVGRKDQSERRQAATLRSAWQSLGDHSDLQRG